MFDEIINDTIETTAETRKRLSKLTDKRLFELLIDVDRSIKDGRHFASFYQEWSVGIDILYKRGYGYLTPSGIQEVYNNEWG